LAYFSAVADSTQLTCSCETGVGHTLLFILSMKLISGDYIISTSEPQGVTAKALRR